MDPTVLQILKRTEKMYKLEDNPSSITTAMTPRRVLSKWDLNVASRKSKRETIQTTLDILNDNSNEKILQDIIVFPPRGE